MILKIAEKKVNYVTPMLNGEKIIVEIENILTKIKTIIVDEIEIAITTMTVKTAMYAENDYINGNKERGNIIGIYNDFKFDLEDSEDPYETLAIQKIKNFLINQNTYTIVENDIEILSEYTWRDANQTIRLIIPVKEVIENAFYRGLMDALITANIIRYKVGDYYILYLSYIEDDHKVILEADKNVLIEE